VSVTAGAEGPTAGARPWGDVRRLLVERARVRRQPFLDTRADEVEQVLARLDSVEPAPWVEAFGALAEAHERAARGAEAAGDRERAAAEWLLAAGYWRVARYPAPTSAPKRAAHERARSSYLAAARYFDPPLEEVRIPFRGRAGDGDHVLAHLRRPHGLERPPVAVVWGGIDAFKEERRGDAYLAEGLATLAMEMPGIGGSPIVGAPDAERLWDPVFEWLGARDDVDGTRIGIVGGSTGGYWAVKLAHVRRDRIAAAACHGGCVHHAFTREWMERAQVGEYPFEFGETLAAAFGLRTYEEWVAFAPRLSLLDAGILDRPCAPLLLVNGANDTVFPIADMHLLLERGDPKSARFYQAGHMGPYRDAEKLIARWLATTLRAPAERPTVAASRGA